VLILEPGTKASGPDPSPLRPPQTIHDWCNGALRPAAAGGAGAARAESSNARTAEPRPRCGRACTDSARGRRSVRTAVRTPDNTEHAVLPLPGPGSYPAVACVPLIFHWPREDHQISAAAQARFARSSLLRVVFRMLVVWSVRCLPLFPDLRSVSGRAFPASQSLFLPPFCSLPGLAFSSPGALVCCPLLFCFPPTFPYRTPYSLSPSYSAQSLPSSRPAHPLLAANARLRVSGTAALLADVPSVASAMLTRCAERVSVPWGHCVHLLLTIQERLFTHLV